jgi:hypothetical protein
MGKNVYPTKRVAKAFNLGYVNFNRSKGHKNWPFMEQLF